MPHSAKAMNDGRGQPPVIINGWSPFFQQYRLSERILIVVWVNDEQTKRAYGNRSA